MDVSFARSVEALAQSQGVRCAPGLRGAVHLEEEDLRIASYHAKGHLGQNSDFDIWVHNGDDKIGRLYLQSIMTRGTKVYVVPETRRDEIASFFEKRLHLGPTGEIKVLDAWLYQLHRFEIEWK